MKFLYSYHDEKKESKLKKILKFTLPATILIASFELGHNLKSVEKKDLIYQGKSSLEGKNYFMFDEKNNVKDKRFLNGPDYTFKSNIKDLNFTKGKEYTITLDKYFLFEDAISKIDSVK